MRVRTLHPHQPAAKVNVTPLIDVVMVLIIFYLIVGNLARDPLPSVTLPTTGLGSTEEAMPDLVITVQSAEGQTGVVVEGVTLEAADLERLLRSRLSDPAGASVHIRADRSLAYERVAPVIAACRAAGLRSVRLVAQRGERP